MAAALYTRHRTNGPNVQILPSEATDLTPYPANRFYVSTTSKPTIPFVLTSWDATATVTNTSSALPAWSKTIGATAQVIGGGSNSNMAVLAARDQLLGVINAMLSEDNLSSDSLPMIAEWGESSISDTPTANFQKKISEGRVVNNACLNDNFVMKVQRTVVTDLTRRYKLSATLLDAGSTDLYGIAEDDPDVIPLAPPSDEDVSDIVEYHKSVLHSSSFNARDTAINAAFGKVNSGAFEYLVELGERKETIAYIAKNLQRIASMFKAVKRGKWKDIVPRTYARARKLALKRAKRNGTSFSKEMSLAILDFTSQAWMELRFAIRPLVISVDDAIKISNEGIKTHSGRSVQNYRCSAVGSDEIISEEILSDRIITTVHTIESHREATAGVLINISTTLADMRNLGFTNIAGTLWELTFLSWLADYFVNTDGLLYHLTPNIGVDVLTAWSGTNDDILVTSTVTTTTLGGEILEIVEYSTKRNLYFREPVDGPGYLTLDINLDTSKLLDVGFVFYGLLKSFNK